MNKRKRMKGIICGILAGVLLLGLVSGALITLLGR